MLLKLITFCWMQNQHAFLSAVTHNPKHSGSYVTSTEMLREQRQTRAHRPKTGAVITDIGSFKYIFLVIYVNGYYIKVDMICRLHQRQCYEV